MKTSLLLSLLILINLSLFAQADYKDFPDYKEVVRKLDNLYHLSKLEPHEELRVEKRKDGYWVAVYDMTENGKMDFSQMFWSADSMKYLKMQMIPKPEGLVASSAWLKRSLNRSFEEKYNSCPYFGYVGWDKDVIDDFGSDETLSDSALYGLGRAYDSYVINLIDGRYGLADTSITYSISFGQNQLNEEQLKTIRYNYRKSIECYRKLFERNPDFEVWIGSIENKMAAQYVAAFLDLRVIQNEEEAAKELVDGLFEPYVIEYAKNILNSLPPNAILFTHGDMDTYPLLYIQKQYNIRKDVLVLNTSLLNLVRYVDHCRRPILDAQPLPFNTPTKVLDDERKNYILIREESNEYVELQSFIDTVRYSEKFTQIGGRNYFTFPYSRILFTHNEKAVSWEIPKTHLLFSNLIVLEAILYNKWERPVYFTHRNMVDRELGMTDFLWQEGIVYRLLPENRKNNNPYHKTNFEIWQNNLQTNYKYTTDSIKPSAIQIIAFYQQSYLSLASSLFNEGKKEQALKMMDELFKVYPFEKFSFIEDNIWAIRVYYDMEETETANKLTKQLLGMIENFDQVNSRGFKNKDQARDYILNMLNNYGQSQILNQ